jgi:hypothetical protein
MSGESDDLNFRPQDPFAANSRLAVESNLGRTFDWPEQGLTRAQAAAWIVSQLGWS